MTSIGERFFSAFALGMTKEFGKSVERLAHGEPTTPIHTAIHQALLDTDVIYRDKFQRYASGLGIVGSARNERIDNLKKEVVLSAVDALILSR